MVNWSIWPFIQIANLRYVPVMYQVLVVNFCALFWNLYLTKKSYDVDKLPLGNI